MLIRLGDVRGGLVLPGPVDQAQRAGLPVERRIAGQHPVHHRAQGTDVRVPADPVGLPGHLLGRGVERGEARHRGRVVAAVRPLVLLCQAEVDELDLPVLGQGNVGRLEIEVDQAQIPGGAQAREYLHGEVQHLADVQRVLLGGRAQVPFERGRVQAGDDVEAVLHIEVAIQHFGDVGVDRPQRQRHLHLGMTLFPERLAAHGPRWRRDDLDDGFGRELPGSGPRPRTEPGPSAAHRRAAAGHATGSRSPSPGRRRRPVPRRGPRDQ